MQEVLKQMLQVLILAIIQKMFYSLTVLFSKPHDPVFLKIYRNKLALACARWIILYLADTQHLKKIIDSITEIPFSALKGNFFISLYISGPLFSFIFSKILS